MNNPQPLRLQDAARVADAVPVERFRRLAAPGQTVLMLQGPASSLWSGIGTALAARGARVVHVRLGFGDWLYWTGPGKRLSYRGSLARWEGWLEALIEREGVTDILYYGDRLPYHLAAQRVALRRSGLRAWAFELGYLRPNWMTLEPFAMGRFSRFPRDPATIRALAEGQPRASLRAEYRHPFAKEAANEVIFSLAQVFGRAFYPRYVSGRALAPVVEYLAWLRRMARAARARDEAAREERRHVEGPEPFVLVALQLETDYQIRASSDYASQTEMLEEVVASFAGHAPPSVRLLVKIHPHDPEILPWRRVVAGIAARHGVGDRVRTIRGGNLGAMLSVAWGLVTTNSTTGVTALALGCPVRVMGDAVYDVPGLTHCAGLDSFWTAPEQPCPKLFDAWTRAAAATIQLRGSLFNPRGQRRAAAEVARRITNPRRFWRVWRDIPSGF